jgi:hypothetical protein
MMATLLFTVECASHGEMRHSFGTLAWVCPEWGCPALLPDEDVQRLVTAAPRTGEPVQLVVAPASPPGRLGECVPLVVTA